MRRIGLEKMTVWEILHGQRGSKTILGQGSKGRRIISVKYSDFDRTGELGMYSIALLSKQEKLDTLSLRERAREKIKE